VACAPPQQRSAPARSGADPERQRILEFWQQQNAATAARTRGDLAEAARLYEAALALQPRHEDALYYLGQCRRELGEPGAARSAFERLLEVDPASARGHLALGALLASPDPAEPLELGEAERHLRRAHEINGEETGPVLRLGEIALVAGRADEAAHWFDSVLRTNPKSLEAAFLAGFVGWDAGRPVEPLVRRVQQAARVEAPTRGVLGEGDRRQGPKAAPPLTSPVGSLLFGAPIEKLREDGADEEPPTGEAVIAQWRCGSCSARTLGGRSDPRGCTLGRARDGRSPRSC